ncbi:unnamed protein product [Symbiodinium microadriaticum]|nr:unnamed protein product [Symbiodinium microadriaticum]
MNKVSEGAKDGFEILTQAVEDIISNLSSKEAKTIQIRSSNITQWRHEVQKWLQAQSDDIILVQETHLTKEGVTSAVSAMHKAGYEMFGGESAPSNKKGMYGGVAIFSRTQFKARTVQHFTIEGCGFCAAEVRVKGVSLLLVSVYLKNSTPIQSHPNAEILGRLVALVRAHVGQWLVAGDFNLTPHELSATNILSEMRGHLLTVGEATAHGGNEIDFAITSYAISSLVQADLDWSAPHRPHASLRVQITMPRNTVTSLRLPEFSVKDAAENATLSEARPTAEEVTILNRCFRRDDITQDYASFSKWCQQAMYPDENTARGGSLAFVRKPVVQGQPLRRHSDQAGLRLRVESWLNATVKGGVKISERAIQDVISKLQFSTPSPECERFRAEILALLTGSERNNTALETRIKEHIKQAQDEHLAQDKQRYHEWLEGAMVKGMRPLYRAIRAHEQVLVRPFRNKEAAVRPYLRHAQWQKIWKSQNIPVPAVVPELLGRAVAEAARLPALTTSQVQTRIKRLPDKAPGVEGWNNRMLKQLPHEAIGPLTELLNHVENTGLAPGQWSITKFAMLAKNQAIERPIGLCSVVYKAWLQMRYPLVQAWLQGYEKVAPWDAAVPGVTCLSVSIARVFKCEVAVATGRHRATLYLDLSTFYETLSHAKLIESAMALNFPASVLNIALQIYRGGRIIDAEGNMGPISFTDRGVIAGCPAAPALSKLALYKPLKTVQETGLCAGLDSWIDDVTIDAEDTDPQRAAQKIVSLYRTVSAELGNAELQISTSKSAFVCTDKQTQARVQQLLRQGEPPVLHLVKDLGVDSAGARRRRVATSNARLAKATGRSNKLAKLKVTNPKKRAQVAATGVFTAATFGGHYGKMAFGSLDLLFDLSWRVQQAPLKALTGLPENVVPRRYSKSQQRRWAEVDIGPDPEWRNLFPQAPECFKVRKTGIFTGEFLPGDNVYFGTDASGGPRGEVTEDKVLSSADKSARACEAAAMGGGKGKGKQKSHRSAEEIQHARAVNQRRDESSLPKKSTGSVSRSKARSAAYHAAMSAPVSADRIAEPKVRPPPPPPPRRGEGIRLVPRDEILSHSTAQPGTSSKGTAPQPTEPKAKTGGEFLPPAKSSPKKRDHGEQRRSKQKVHKRGEDLPQTEMLEAHASSQRLLPQDDMELNISSSTEEEATSYRAAPAPEEHRDNTRTNHEGNLASKQIVCLHGRVTCLGVPRDVLRSIPPQLGSEWGGGPHGGPSGVILNYIARGSDKLAFEADGLVLKLSEGTQREELLFSGKLPSVTATTYWIEKIQVHLHKEDGTVWHNYSLFLSCQEKAVRASELMSSRGETWAFRFLAYVGCLLTWLTARGLSLKDTGALIGGVMAEPTALTMD